MSRELDVYGAIAAKRDGGELRPGIWRSLVQGFVAGSMPDYQMSALLMAVSIRGLTQPELVELTTAMVDSGTRVDLSALGFTADKHSTGGVGDKTTLVVAPLVASAGVPVAKMSGRGLGHTGGTLDKLEAIPGFEVEISPERFLDQVRRVGVAVIGQRSDLVPADKALYALRDVTATVESVPLIAASIVSKKVVGGASAVVFDVKTGAGAFVRECEDARELGRSLVALAEEMGLRALALLSAMDQPLGRAVGNALEVAEAIEALSGEGPEDLVELACTIAARMVALKGEMDAQGAREAVRRRLESGDALAVFARWVEAQGGDPRVVEDPGLLPKAPIVRTLRAEGAGWVSRLDAMTVARVASALGAGRRRKEDEVDPRVGVVCAAKMGDLVEAGDVLMAVHAPDEARADEALVLLRSGVHVAADPTDRPQVVIDQEIDL